MIAYFDTSALISLVIDEPGSERASEVWRSSSRQVTCRLTFVESHAALAQAFQQGRLTARAHRQAIHLVEALFEQLLVVEIDSDLVQRASTLAFELELRGYDAVHAAAAELIEGDAPASTVLATGDDALLAAARALSLATADTAERRSPG